MTNHNDCPGRKDCPPPDFMYRIYASTASFGAFFLLDMLFYRAMQSVDGFTPPFAKDDPSMVTMLLGYATAAILFSELYINFARSPKYSDDSEKSRTFKGSMYGLLLGAIIFIPSIFFDNALLQDMNIGNQVLDSAYHLLQFAVTGIMIAHILKYDPPN